MVLQLSGEMLSKSASDIAAMLSSPEDPVGARLDAVRVLRLRPTGAGLKALDGILANPAEPVALRVAATLALANFEPKAAAPILALALAAPERRVLRAALRTLGRTAGSEGLAAALQVAKARPDEPAARFAARLIAYRHRLDRPDLMLGREGIQTLAPGTADGARIEIRRLIATEGAAAIEQVMTDPIGVQLDPEATFEDICGGVRRLIAFARPFTGPDGPASLARAPAVLGIIGVWSDEAERFASDQTLLATPGGAPGTGLLHAVDGRGEVMQFGSYDGDRFEIASVDRPGAVAIAMTGRYADGELKLETGTCAPRSERQVSPEPFVFAR